MKHQATMELEEGHDRISQLPDEVLHQILSLLPIKSLARAGVLSQSWYTLLNDLQLPLLHLDFGEEFSSGKSPEELVGSINLCLSFHDGNRVRSFRLFFYPSVNSNCDVENWVQFAVDKGVEDLELDFGHEYGPFPTRYHYMEEEDAKRFELPVCLSSCNSLTRMKLTRFNFSLPSDFNGLSLLTELCLKEVNMTDEMLERIILKCPFLHILSLRQVTPLSTVKVSSPNSRLKYLTVADCEVTGIELDAPHLTLFYFCGDLYDGSFKNLSSMTDAIISSVGVDCYNLGYLRTGILAKISRVEILTVCYKTLWDMERTEEWEPEVLPISLLHLKELQILFDGLLHDCLIGFYCFFRNCTLPLLESLFIELDHSCSLGNLIEEATGERGSPPDHRLCNLRIVKINGMHYCENEILLVEFLLAMAPSLEYMVLIASESILGESLDTQVSSFHKQLMQLPKASSKVQILVSEHAEDDLFPCPTHTEAQYAPYYTFL